MMPYKEVHKLEIINSPGNMCGAICKVVRPGVEHGVTYEVTKLLKDDGQVQTYEMEFIRE